MGEGMEIASEMKRNRNPLLAIFSIRWWTHVSHVEIDRCGRLPVGKTSRFSKR